jgi:hypothetical protein
LQWRCKYWIYFVRDLLLSRCPLTDIVAHWCLCLLLLSMLLDHLPVILVYIWRVLSIWWPDLCIYWVIFLFTSTFPCITSFSNPSCLIICPKNFMMPSCIFGINLSVVWIWSSSKMDSFVCLATHGIQSICLQQNIQKLLFISGSLHLMSTFQIHT